uniref:Nucleolin-like n=1 Tax=Mesocestoides corti TaxID=53468 RepID=A0A5K3FZ28_MESCO
MEPEEFIDNNYAAESEEEEEVEESEPSEHVDEEASHSPVDNRQCDDQQLRFVLLEFALKFYPELAECISKCVSNEECAVVEPEEQNYSPPFDDKPMEPEEFIDNNYAAESEEEEEEEEEEGYAAESEEEEEEGECEERCKCDRMQLLQFLADFFRDAYPEMADCIPKCVPRDDECNVEPEEHNYSPPINDKCEKPEDFIDNNYAAESEEEEEEEEESEPCGCVVDDHADHAGHRLDCVTMEKLILLLLFTRHVYPEITDGIRRSVCHCKR